MPNISQARIQGVVYDIKDAVAREMKNDVETINKGFMGGNILTITTDWKNGSYNDSTGALDPSTTTRVVSRKFNVYKGNVINVKFPAGYQFKFCKWRTSGAWIDSGSWAQAETSLYASEDMVVSIMAAKTDFSELDPTTVSATISVKGYFYDNAVLMNSLNRLVGYVPGNTSRDGITISYNNGILKYQGTATALTYFDLVSSLNSLPDGVTAGENYYLSYNTPYPEYTLLTVYFNHGSGWQKAYDSMNGLTRIKIPSDAVGILVRVYFRSGITFPVTYTPVTLSEQPSNRDLLYKINHSGSSENGNSVQVRFLEERGTGDCAVLKYADGTVLVIDFGYPDTAVQTLETRWSEVVGELEIDHIDYAIISHYHSDHCGLLTEGAIDSLIDAQTTFFLPRPFTQEQLSALQIYDQRAEDRVYATYNAAIAKIDAAGCHKLYPTEGAEFEIGGSIVKFWNTDHTTYLDRIAAGTLLDYNPCSLCNYVTIGNMRMMFTGDISNEVMTDYIDRVLPSQIFKVNHHCTGYDAIPKFMSCVMPELAITQCGDTLVSTVTPSNQHLWFEQNGVPNVPTGLNKKTLSLTVTSSGYIWNTPCRRLIVADEQS